MKSLLKIIIVAGFVTASFSSLAADWTITQSATITTPTPNLRQGAGTSTLSSRQAINGVVLNGAEDDLVSGSQTAIITAPSMLDMGQSGGTTTGSSQAVNYIFAKNIGAGGTPTGVVVTQRVMVTGGADIQQVTGGDRNVQGGNVMVTSASGNIVNAEQNFTASAQINLTQGGVGINRVQALNLADTTANSAGTVSSVSQTFESTATEGVSFIAQTAGERNVQAGNMVDSRGSITDLTQTFSAGNTNSVSFRMTEFSFANNIQAGNMARTDGVASVITEITQTFTGSDTANTFDMRGSSDNRVQAGNLIALGSGALADNMMGPHQMFAVMGSISMYQQGRAIDALGGANSLQALNAITDKPGIGMLTTYANQSLTTSGAFTMEQHSVGALSGQFGNFAGMSLVMSSP